MHYTIKKYKIFLRKKKEDADANKEQLNETARRTVKTETAKEEQLKQKQLEEQLKEEQLKQKQLEKQNMENKIVVKNLSTREQVLHRKMEKKDWKKNNIKGN